MKASDKAINLIKTYEGFKDKAYLCPASKWTIGYGSTFYADNAPVKSTDVITEPKALSLLKHTVQEIFVPQLQESISIKLNQNQFDALVSFIYNVGVGNFRSSTLLKKINIGDFVAAAKEFDRWVYGNNKQKLMGLVNRRKAERSLFETEAKV